MRKDITNEAGAIKLGDTLLPGVFTSIEVDGKLRIDEKEVPGQSGKSKQPLGFEDAKISLKLRLITDEETDCYDKAAVLVNLFQTVDKQAKPYVYRIVNRLLELWHITEVLFEDIKIRDNKGSDTLQADLSFTEYKPALVAVEAKAEVTATADFAAGLPDVLTDGTGIDLSEFEVMETDVFSSDGGDLRSLKEVDSPAIDDDWEGV